MSWRIVTGLPLPCPGGESAWAGRAIFTIIGWVVIWAAAAGIPRAGEATVFVLGALAGLLGISALVPKRSKT